MTLAKGVIIFKVWVYRLPWGLFLNLRLENFISQIVHSNCLFNYVQLFVWVFAGALGGQQGGQIGSSGAGVVGQHLWEQENEPPCLARATSAQPLNHHPSSPRLSLFGERFLIRKGQASNKLVLRYECVSFLMPWSRFVLIFISIQSEYQGKVTKYSV